jgi:outer membrane protein OmpA-like peptidoglycan-associated protein
MNTPRHAGRSGKVLQFALPLAVIAALAGPPTSRPAAAQADPCAGALSSAAIVGCLRPDAPGARTRGIRPATMPATVPGTPGKATQPQAAAAPTVNLTVTFAFDSAELTAEGAAALAALGSALKDPTLADARFLIGGHTDAAGSAAHNRVLSERRAETARRFLIERAGVDAGRLVAAGFGPTRLYDTADPLSAANRRVQVSRL